MHTIASLVCGLVLYVSKINSRVPLGSLHCSHKMKNIYVGIHILWGKFRIYMRHGSANGNYQNPSYATSQFSMHLSARRLYAWTMINDHGRMARAKTLFSLLCHLSSNRGLEYRLPDQLISLKQFSKNGNNSSWHRRAAATVAFDTSPLLVMVNNNIAMARARPVW